MKERLLLKCRTSLEAQEIQALLFDNKIISRLHDESQDQRTGAYGPIVGFSIYVFEQDYEDSRQLIKHILENNQIDLIHCPRCGSEAVKNVKSHDKQITIVIIVSIFLIFISGCYWVFISMYNLDRNPICDYITLGMLFVALLLIVFTKKTVFNYTCESCNKKFNHL